MNASQIPVRIALQASTALLTQRPDNFQENGQWVGPFKTGDKVQLSDGRIGVITACFGYAPGGYGYFVRLPRHALAHLREHQMTLAPPEEAKA